MRILLHYSPGPTWQRDLASLNPLGLEIDCCDESDDIRSLFPVSSGRDSLARAAGGKTSRHLQGEQAPPHSEDRGRRKYHRPRCGESTWHRNLQHAGHKYPSRGRNDLIAHAGMLMGTMSRRRTCEPGGKSGLRTLHQSMRGSRRKFHGDQFKKQLNQDLSKSEGRLFKPAAWMVPKVELTKLHKGNLAVVRHRTRQAIWPMSSVQGRQESSAGCPQGG
jgi:hypothetical protein